MIFCNFAAARLAERLARPLTNRRSAWGRRRFSAKYVNVYDWLRQRHSREKKKKNNCRDKVTELKADGSQCPSAIRIPGT